MKITRITALVAFTMTAHADRPAARPSDEIGDPRVIAAMIGAWVETGLGTSLVEAAFRLDGTRADYIVVVEHATNQQARQAISIIPGVTFGVFHVHPNIKDPEPSVQDKKVADRHFIKVFTIHARGLYVYDPVLKKTTKLRDGYTWMKPSPEK